jgi:hypothetical protein
LMLCRHSLNYFLQIDSFMVNVTAAVPPLGSGFLELPVQSAVGSASKRVASGQGVISARPDTRVIDTPFDSIQVVRMMHVSELVSLVFVGSTNECFRLRGFAPDIFEKIKTSGIAPFSTMAKIYLDRAPRSKRLFG